MINITLKRLSLLQRHISNVRTNTVLIGTKLIEKEEKWLGLQLISNGEIHDNSKFHGIEWDYLHLDVKEKEPEQFLFALQQHIQSNPHHPEYWGGIENMPRVYIAEMVTDWAARSSEFGNDLREWIKHDAIKQFKFTLQGRVYKEIKEFVDLLLEPKFK